MTKRKKDDDGVLSTLGLRRPWDLGSSSCPVACPGRLSVSARASPPRLIHARRATRDYDSHYDYVPLRSSLSGKHY